MMLMWCFSFIAKTSTRRARTLKQRTPPISFLRNIVMGQWVRFACALIRVGPASRISRLRREKRRMSDETGFKRFCWICLETVQVLTYYQHFADFLINDEETYR